ncbi:hypothetical protein B7755_000780 [Streptomyces sp. NBS 14/10]|uniref:hypothetical protein n=1 Tax=Streptomyces sp. NBS 14/10 TaxID=1945643 RepID=UPI0015C591F6|nr:hypothetical protein [Streptomyces sp. NBS 14/10]KAK1186534.1 hypothetical protein B7755_000780 [Streptomyces sp. NBS 14/10]
MRRSWLSAIRSRCSNANSTDPDYGSRRAGLKESIAHVGVTRDAITLLTEADQLIPADLGDAQLCEALLETLR